MAAKKPDNLKPTDISNDGSVKRWSWTGANALANGDTTEPVGYPEYADRSWQFDGVFGVGGNVIVEGSNNDGASYFQKNDLSGGNPIAKTAAGGEGVAEATQAERARVTAGDVNTAITAFLTIRRSNPRGM